MRKSFSVGITAIIVLLLLLLIFGLNTESGSLKQYKQTVGNSKYIRHALGGMDNNTYIDSIDALNYYYANGDKLYEVDVNFTSDDQLVLVHGWSESDYKERIGKEYNADNPIPTYNEFMSWKIQNKYTPTSFRDLVNFMKKHNDMYVMLDFGNRSYEDTLKAYKAVVAAAENNDSILNRFIVGGHTTDMIKAVKEVYDFKIINLYLQKEKKREEQLKNLDDYINYCKNNQITSFSVSVANYTPEVAEKMKDSGLISYVFTTDDISEADSIMSMGANIIGTNFLIK
ncbi:MAG: hypothetical protein HUJ76_06615 [Parasporobacterium sp.]|nr:hypothetical protein [Parasporobacterium sp.]